jgi:two-component system cell cycle sensor histidine kinase/response regulator CckA
VALDRETQPAVMARTFAYLYGAGGTLVLVTLALPHPSDRFVPGLIAPALIALCVALVMWIGFERIPVWVFHFLPAGGAVLVTIVLASGGKGALDAYAMLYIWVILSAFSFFGPLEAAANLALVGFGYGAVLVTKASVADVGLRWLMAMGALTVVGIVLALLREQIDRLIDAMARDMNDRRRAERMARESEDRLRLILETAHEAFISMDSMGVITDWNEEAETVFGWPRGEAIGRPLAEMVIPLDYREAHRKGMARFLETGEDAILNRPVEIAALHRDGHEFPVEVTISPLRIRGSYTFNAFLRDITERRRAEGHLAAQHAVTSVLATCSTVEEAVPRLLESIGESMGWEVGSFWTLDRDAGLMRCAGSWSSPAFAGGRFEDVSREMIFRRGEGLPGHVWTTGQPAWVQDMAESVAFARAPVALEQGLRNAVALPLLSEHEVLGSIDFFSTEIRALDEDMIRMLETISSQIGQFMERKAAEREAERFKEEFFMLVSHELRTPLTSILGYLDLLAEDERENLSERGMRSLEVIERNSNRLLRLVGDLLFVARVMETGELTLELAPVDMEAILREAVEAAMPRAEQQEIRLELETESAPRLEGDRDRLGEVVDNLLSNALKYTPKGERVLARLSREGDAITIAVWNTGAYIPEDERERLFERFYRASTATTDVPGIGLGLTITKAIVEAHGGKIEAESEPGEGTTFRVRFPLPRMLGNLVNARAPAGAGAGSVVSVPRDAGSKDAAALQP